MHYMHDKMIGKGVLYHNWHYSVNTWTMRDLVCKMWYYKRSTMKSILRRKTSWGSKREKSGGTALQKKSCLMPEKRYVGLQLDEKLK